MIMKHIKSIIVVAVLGMASTATAQNLNTGYFNDGYLYRHEVNPAFGNNQGYVAMPGIGNLNVGVNSNLRVDNIFYNVNGRTALFLNPEVSDQKFLRHIKTKHKIYEDLKLQILGAGFKAFGGYNTVEINARQSLQLNVPGSLLRLAKEGVQNKTYQINKLAAHVDAYAELALGHSHQIDEHLRVGGKAKLLLGIGNMDADFRKATLTLGEDKWTAITDAKVQTSLKRMKYKMEEKERGADGEETTHRYVSGIEDTNWSVDGVGVAFDLGAEYKVDDNWSFSAAVLDLGFINWNNNYVASTRGERLVNTDTHLFSLDDDKDNSFEREGDRLMEDIAKLYELDDLGDQGKRSRMLATTINAGVEYTPDFYDKLSIGLLSSTRVAGKYTTTEVRLSANVSPTNIFSASTSLAVNSFGTSFGWLINFHPCGFNIFLATDHQFGKMSKQGIPLSGRANVNFGINFPFGH